MKNNNEIEQLKSGTLWNGIKELNFWKYPFKKKIKSFVIGIFSLIGFIIFLLLMINAYLGHPKWID